MSGLANFWCGNFGNLALEVVDGKPVFLSLRRGLEINPNGSHQPQLAFSMFPLGVFLDGSDDANKYDYKAVVQKTDAAHAARRSAKAE